MTSKLFAAITVDEKSAGTGKQILCGSVSFVIDESNLKGVRSRQKFWLGGAAPQTPQFLAGGAKPPQTPPLNGRSSHLIEAAKRGRLDQMIFFRRR